MPTVTASAPDATRQYPITITLELAGSQLLSFMNGTVRCGAPRLCVLTDTRRAELEPAAVHDDATADARGFGERGRARREGREPAAGQAVHSDRGQRAG